MPAELEERTFGPIILYSVETQTEHQLGDVDSDVYGEKLSEP